MDHPAVSGTEAGRLVRASPLTVHDGLNRPLRLGSTTDETRAVETTALITETGRAAIMPETQDPADRRMARDRAEAARFFGLYERNLRRSSSNREAYEETERDYTARTGGRRFRTYGSFRSAYCQFCRRLQLNRRMKVRAADRRPGVGAAHFAAAFYPDVNTGNRGC